MPHAGPAVTSTRQRRARQTTLYIGVVFVTVGAAAFAFGFVVPFVAARGTDAWLETACMPITADGFGGDSRQSNARMANVSATVAIVGYHYRFGRVDYESDRVDAISSGRGPDAMRQFAASHKAGWERVCYVDATDPSAAVLVRGVPGRLWLAGLGSLVFVGAGAACLYSFVCHPASAFGVADAARQRRAHFSIDDPEHDR